MFKCEDCKEVFEKYAVITEDTGECWGVCPCCNGDVEIVKECDCGDYMSTDEMFCDKCKSDLKRQFSRLLHENFDEKEIQMLNELFDGEELN